jgi:hypothetical protein
MLRTAVSQPNIIALAEQLHEGPGLVNLAWSVGTEGNEAAAGFMGGAERDECT